MNLLVELNAQFSTEFTEVHAHQLCEIKALNDTDRLTKFLGDVHIVKSAEEVSSCHEAGVPKSILPFLLVRQPECVDYYGFEIRDPAYPVVVFAVHTVVQTLPDLNAFIGWIKAGITADRSSLR